MATALTDNWETTVISTGEVDDYAYRATMYHDGKLVSIDHGPTWKAAMNKAYAYYKKLVKA